MVFLGICITHYFLVYGPTASTLIFSSVLVGVCQGCVLSPTLFFFSINQQANHVTENGRHGIQLVPGVMELFILSFADDVALLSTTYTDLQKPIKLS